MSDEPMACRGILVSLKCLKTTGALRIEIEVPKELANEAHKALGGFPDPAKSRHVGMAIITDERKV